MPGLYPLESDSAPALRQLLGALQARGYRFITPTPETHARVVARSDRRCAQDLADVFGWSLPFDPRLVGPDLLALLEAAGVLAKERCGLRSRVRVASLGDDLYIHSAYPPGPESVFFGPDTYRFVRFIRDKFEDAREIGVLVDLGAGTGAGAIAAARRTRPVKLILTDVNPVALDMARINLAAAGVDAEFRCGRGMDPVCEGVDLIIANPPFVAGGGRTYSDGGDMHGVRTSLEWALAGSAALTSGGRMILYTGVAIVKGADRLHETLKERLDASRFDLAYEEIDPDIFGEILDLEAYREVERIAAVGAVIRRRTP
jgi:predicted RNA methylase